MVFDAWLTLAVLFLVFAALIFSSIPADVALVGGLTLLLLTGVLTTDQALAGLANEGMVTIGVLYIMVAGLRETGAIAWISDIVLRPPKNLKDAQIKLMTPVALFSGFLNNTPIVAMLIPAVNDWAKKHRISVSKLMMPLSYAAIIGGTCTLIGTSTNLVVNGLLQESDAQYSLGMFELAWVGIPCVVVTIIFVVVTSRWLLKERQPVMSQFSDAREYTVEMLVAEDSPLIGKSIEEAGLRSLPGMYLIEIDRKNQTLPAVSPQERLQAHDRLVFVGIIESVVDLQKIRGLTPATDQVFKIDTPRPERSLTEAVVSNSCPLIGKTIREGRFRTYYDAAIIAVARNGEPLRQKIGDIVLQTGDTLLLETHPEFVARQRNSRDFFLVSRLDGYSPPRHDRAFIALGILGVLVATVSFGLLTILEAAMVTAGLMLITRCTRPSSARREVDWQVLIVIAAAFGLGQAMQVSGLANTMANSLVSLTADGPWFSLIAIYFVTALLSALVTNNAAAVIMFPIAYSTAITLDVNIIPFAIAIMIAASTSFATPIGYQTNLMVAGPGGYHFRDFLRMGLPLTFIVGVTAIVLIPLIWPFY